jgi:hypothetical protein
MVDSTVSGGRPLSRMGPLRSECQSRRGSAHMSRERRICAWDSTRHARANRVTRLRYGRVRINFRQSSRIMCRALTESRAAEQEPCISKMAAMHGSPCLTRPGKFSTYVAQMGKICMRLTSRKERCRLLIALSFHQAILKASELDLAAQRHGTTPASQSISRGGAPALSQMPDAYRPTA